MKEYKDELALSQLFTLHGELINQTLGAAHDTSGQKQAGRQLDGVIIDQKYKVICLLGEGGMGAVYKAHHLLLNKEVALKTFRSPNLSDESWKRFQREAQAIARLSHINIVQVFDFGVAEDNVPYYTMECLSGQSLADRLKAGGQLPLEQAIRLFLQVCQGLALAHSKGIIHRDLKPANIFLASESTAAGQVDIVKIVDFGIAGLARRSQDEQKLTSAGTIFGSPLYMSPEQSRAEELTERSDIYSCGCALFETLTGSPPFKGAHALATMVQHQANPPPRLVNKSGEIEFPQRLEALIAKMLAKNVDDRFHSFNEVSAELEGVLEAHKLKLSTGPQAASLPAMYQPPQNDQPLQNNQPLRNNPPLEINQPSLQRRSPKLLVLSSIFCLALLSVAAMDGLLRTRPAKVASIQRQVSAPKPQVQAVKILPYLQNPGARGLVWRHFVFPDDKSLGIIEWDFEAGAKHLLESSKHRQARGYVNVPPQTLIRLQAFEDLSKEPELFSGFTADDLNGLVLNGEFPWSDRHIRYCSKLTHLADLSMDEADVTDNCINDLNQLSRLRHLSVKNTHLTDNGLARLKCLQNLVSFSASGQGSISQTLKKMTNSQMISDLEMDDCKLTESDMKTIATMANLQKLIISRNKDLADRGLLPITKLKRLLDLRMGNTNATSACIGTLKNITALNRLSINLTKWSAADQKRLREALPQCEIYPVEDGDVSEQHRILKDKYIE
jgi:serine/threonine protein kinase